MAAPKKKTAPAATEPVIEIEPAQEVPESTWARLKREAAQLRSEAPPPEFEPYVFDGVEPPIVIPAPTTNEQRLTMAELTEADGGIQVRNLRKMIKAITGDQFDRVWEVIGPEDQDFLIAFINDIRRKFNPNPGKGSADVPGKPRG